MAGEPSVPISPKGSKDYAQKLSEIQQYNNGLHFGMDQLRGNMHMNKNALDLQVQTETILELFGNFLDWFESTFTVSLYNFSCVLLNSKIEAALE